VDAEALLAELAESRELHVKLTDMPDTAQYTRFLAEMRARPGTNTIVLMTPEGEARLETRTALTTSDSAVISMCLGGAEVVWAPQSVDGDAVVAGLTL
jgi:hypothetical protein